MFQDVDSTTVFYQFIASLRQKIRAEVKETSSAHKFVRTLRDGGRLMRCYTQNIDGLEAREDLCVDLARGKGNKRRFMKKHYEVPRPLQTQGTDFDGGCEVVQLHGDLDKLRCNMCSTQIKWTDEETRIFLEGAAPNCQKCRRKSAERQATGKRGLAVGSLRPNIVLYGEEHPANTLLTPLIPFDAGSQPDVLIIMGTSLKVFGLQKIVRKFAHAVHAHKQSKGRVIFVNRTRPAESMWDGIIDYYVSMDCDDWVDDLKTRRGDLWLRQGEIDLKITKTTTAAKRKRKSAMVNDDNHSTTIEEPPPPPTPPHKKARVGIERPQHCSSIPLVVPNTPRGNKSCHSTRRPAGDYPGRAILSPLAQAKRPVPSPLTNSFKPLVSRGTGGPILPGSPRTPSVSPITPRVLASSMLKVQVSANPRDERETKSGHEKENRTDQSEALQERALQMSSDSSPHRRNNELPFGREMGPQEEQEETEETPSKGPGGRKMNAPIHQGGPEPFWQRLRKLLEP